MAYTTTPISGLHCILHILAAEDTVPTAATALGELTSLGELMPSREVADYHVYQDEWARKIATTLSVDSLEFEAVYIGNDSQQRAFETAFGTGELSHYAITYAPRDTYATGEIKRFTAIVASFGLMTPMDDKVAVKFTLEVSGSISSAELS